MAWLNYHHLHYFWVAVREGTLTGAARHLRVTPSTVSTQIQRLEKALDARLFRRAGRNLVTTEMGQVVYRYANEIFYLGHELMGSLSAAPSTRPLRLNFGAQDTIPKLIVYRLLGPVFQLPYPVQVVCYEGTAGQLLPKLIVHEVDLIISDAPLSSASRVRAYNHLLGESGLAWFSSAALAGKLRKGFPKSLDGAPVLLPAGTTEMRKTLDRWLAAVGVTPRVVAEFEDVELMMTFGREGRGLFPAHDIIAREIARAHGVRKVGDLAGSSERFYLISAERQLKHPAVVAMTESARETIFSASN